VTEQTIARCIINAFRFLLPVAACVVAASAGAEVWHLLALAASFYLFACGIRLDEANVRGFDGPPSPPAGTVVRVQAIETPAAGTCPWCRKPLDNPEGPA
jgi:hypothetical protein